MLDKAFDIVDGDICSLVLFVFIARVNDCKRADSITPEKFIPDRVNSVTRTFRKHESSRASLMYSLGGMILSFIIKYLCPSSDCL